MEYICTKCEKRFNSEDELKKHYPDKAERILDWMKKEEDMDFVEFALNGFVDEGYK